MVDTLHIYTRVSSQSQDDDGTSLDSQKESGIEKSKVLGMNYKVWNEGGKSSFEEGLSNRPVLRELLSSMEDGSVKHLFVWNTDRLSRNEETFSMIKFKYLIKHDIRLHTPSGEFNLTDPLSKMVMTVLGGIAQYDNEIRTIRMTEGKFRRIKEGRWKGGPPPYGYRLVESKLEVDEYESEWVVKIHQWYQDGYSVADIKDELLKNGVMTRRDKPVWSLGSITALLTNTHYDGYWYFTDKKSDQTVRVECPRIVSPELIQGVKNSWEKRRYKQSDTQRTTTSVAKYTYLLSKLMKCGECGSFYYGNYREGRTSNYYHCGNKTNKYRDKHTDQHVVCGSKRNVRIDTTEKVVWDLVKEILSSSHLYKETIKEGVMGSTESLSKTKEQKKKISKRIDKLNLQVQKVTDTIVDLTTQNLLSETRDLQRVIKRLEENRNETEVEIQTLQNDLQDIEDEGRWVNWLKVWKDRLRDLDNLTPSERHEFLKGIVSNVVVHGTDKQKHRLEVIFEFPWVGDKLEYIDPENKSKGYRILEGKRSKSRRTDLLKKFTT